MLWLVGMAATFSIDSVPGVAGSCVSKPYPREALDFPMWRFQIYGPYGLCRLADPDYKDADGLRAAAKYGFRSTAMHSGGDKGIDQYLDIIEEMSEQYPDITERRWAIDHCRFLNEQHVQRAEKLGIMFSCGPKYVYAGRKGDIGAYAILYGEEMAADVVVPLRRLIDHGRADDNATGPARIPSLSGFGGVGEPEGRHGKGLGAAAAHHPAGGALHVHALELGVRPAGKRAGQH